MYNVEVVGLASAVFDTGAEALRYAMRHVYLGPREARRAQTDLDKGTTVTPHRDVHIVPVAKRRLQP